VPPLTRWQILCLCLPAAAVQVGWTVGESLLIPYLLSLGVSNTVANFAWLINPLFGLFLQPLCGHASDNCQSSFGRRRPFLFVFHLGSVCGLLTVVFAGELLQLIGLPPRTDDGQPSVFFIATIFIGFATADMCHDLLLMPARALLNDQLPDDQTDAAAAAAAADSPSYCFGYGLRLLCHDGTSVAVENVTVRHRLMGGDGTPVAVTHVQHHPLGLQQLWTLRMKDYQPVAGALSTHDDVSVTDGHRLELVTWRRTYNGEPNTYYWHHFRAAPAAPWIAVPAGDTAVHTGEYGYRSVVCADRTARDAACVRLRLNFRGVRWSVTVGQYVAQLDAPWPRYDGSPAHSTDCYDEAPATLMQGGQYLFPVNPATGLRTRPAALLLSPHTPNCTHPQDHDVEHSKSWWALYQPAPDQPTLFEQYGGPAMSLHARILRLFGVGRPDPWAAPDRFGRARWLLADTDNVAWLIGLWLADGSKSKAYIKQTETHVAGKNVPTGHAEACDGIRQLASLIARLRAHPGQPRGALPSHAAFWTDNGGKAAGLPFAGAPAQPGVPAVPADMESMLARNVEQGPTGNDKYNWYPDAMRGSQPHSWFRSLLDDYGIISHGAASRKRVPVELRTDVVRVRRHLLAGYVDGDGHREEAATSTLIVVVAAVVARTLGRDVVDLSRGLGYAVGSFCVHHKRATDEHRAYMVFSFSVSGVQEYLVQAPPVGQLPRVRNPPLVPNTLHPDTIPVRMQYKRIPPFALYDGVNSRRSESCSGDMYSWGFSLRRAPAVVGGASTDYGCPLAQLPPPPPPGQPPAPVHALAGATRNYVGITVQPRPAGHPRAGEQTVLSSDFLILHNSPPAGVDEGNSYFALISSLGSIIGLSMVIAPLDELPLLRRLELPIRATFVCAATLVMLSNLISFFIARNIDTPLSELKLKHNHDDASPDQAAAHRHSQSADSTPASSSPTSPQPPEAHKSSSGEQFLTLSTILFVYRIVPRPLVVIWLCQFFFWYAVLHVNIWTSSYVAVDIYGASVGEEFDSGVRAATVGLLVQAVVSFLSSSVMTRANATFGITNYYHFSALLYGSAAVAMFFFRSYLVFLLLMAVTGVALPAIYSSPFVLIEVHAADVDDDDEDDEASVETEHEREEQERRKEHKQLDVHLDTSHQRTPDGIMRHSISTTDASHTPSLSPPPKRPVKHVSISMPTSTRTSPRSSPPPPLHTASDDETDEQEASGESDADSNETAYDMEFLDEWRGVLTGVYNVTMTIAQIIVGLTSGAMIDWYGHIGIVFVWSGALCVAVHACVALLGLSKPKEEEEGAAEEEEEETPVLTETTPLLPPRPKLVLAPPKLSRTQSIVPAMPPLIDYRLFSTRALPGRLKSYVAAPHAHPPAGRHVRHLTHHHAPSIDQSVLGPPSLHRSLSAPALVLLSRPKRVVRGVPVFQSHAAVSGRPANNDRMKLERLRERTRLFNNQTSPAVRRRHDRLTGKHAHGSRPYHHVAYTEQKRAEADTHERDMWFSGQQAHQQAALRHDRALQEADRTEAALQQSGDELYDADECGSAPFSGPVTAQAALLPDAAEQGARGSVFDFDVNTARAIAMQQAADEREREMEAARRAEEEVARYPFPLRSSLSVPDLHEERRQRHAVEERITEEEEDEIDSASSDDG